MNGDLDERWVLEHPSPTPDLPSMLALPPIARWVCTLVSEFVADTMALAGATLGLAQSHLRWEREEAEARRRATPDLTTNQVSEMLWRRTEENELYKWDIPIDRQR